MKKLLSIFLSTALLFTSVQTSFANEVENVVEVKRNYTPVEIDFISQSEGMSDDKEITVIVEVNDAVMREKYSLSVPDIKLVRTDDGLQNQLEYANKSQEILLDAIADLGVSYNVTERYETVLNAVAIRVDVKSAKEIAKLEEVMSMEISKFVPAPKTTTSDYFFPKDTSSNKMIQVEGAWRNNFSGKGQLIAIIDSGADPNHDLFKNVDTASLRIKSESETQELMKSSGVLNGKYFNPKIPFGFNYADRNTKLMGSSSHGMHVAGIAAGNSDDLKGVAPDAQLAIMRVFSDAGLFGGGTTPEIYNKAIDDAVKLRVDSINMSLGSTAVSDSRLETTTRNALRDAQLAGIAVAVAAGNDGFMGFGLLDGPSASNIDYGVINSPSVSDISISVASVDNAEIKQQSILIEGVDKTINFVLGDKSPKFPSDFKSIVRAGHGYVSDFEGKDVRGKYVLIQRGDASGREQEETTFQKKIKNAQDKGAIGVIIFNNVDGNDMINMAGLDDITIPSAFISKSNGELIEQNIDKKIRFNSEEAYINNPNGYNVSNFSSWGMTPEGNLKPDISAPGGMIYSGINGNGYKIDQGTSMASPHVAGGIAIVKEYVEKTFPTVKAEAKHALIKNILMSSATPRFDGEKGAYISPRGQGAGLLNLDMAVKTKTVILGTNNISSINLGNIDDNTFTVSGKLKNYSNEAQTFEYHGVVATDEVKNGVITLRPEKIASTEDNKKEITVESNSEKNFEITFTLPSDKIAELESKMKNGFFIDGYVIFEDKNSNAEISVPFVGIKGDWSNLDVVEKSIYDLLLEGSKPYYYSKANLTPSPFTHISATVGKDKVVLGEMVDSTFENPKYDKNYIAFSPNGDGRADEASFVGTFLRNYKDAEFAIYKKDDVSLSSPLYKSNKSIDGIGSKNFFFMNPMLGPNLTTSKSSWKWNGRTISDDLVKDGEYKIVFSVKLDGSSKTVQNTGLPIKVDTVLPSIKQSSYDKNAGVYTLTRYVEEGSGIREIYIQAGEEIYHINEDNTTINIPENTDESEASIVLIDNAYNKTELLLKDSIRNGNEKTLTVQPQISFGEVTKDQFEWTVRSLDNEDEVDPYDLKVGRYVLEITRVSDDLTLESDPTIEFTVSESDTDIIVPVKFSYKNKREVIVSSKNPNNASVKIVLVDKKTLKEYPMSKYDLNNYSANVPLGEYRVEVRELAEGYVANIINGDITVNEKGFGSIIPSVEIKKIREKDVTLNINRNGYQGEFTVVFRGRDSQNILFEFNFSNDENSKTIKLPSQMPFDVYVKNINGNYGFESREYEVNGFPPYTLDIELVEGTQSTKVPTKKEALLNKINEAKEIDENDYREGYEELEKILDEAERIYESDSSSQSEIDDVTKRLDDAISGLVPISFVDKSELERKIAEVEEIYGKISSEEYTEDSIRFLAVSIEAAKRVLRSEDPTLNTEQHIADTINLLQRAVDNLARIDGKADKLPLEVLIEEADNIIAEGDKYTDDSISGLEAALEEAKLIYEDEEVDAEQVKTATKSLSEYLAKIETKANRENLKLEIDIAGNIDLRLYKLEGKSEFREALKAAKEIFYDKRAEQEKIDEITNTLKAMREALVLKEQEIFEIEYIFVSITENKQLPDAVQNTKPQNHQADSRDISPQNPNANMENGKYFVADGEGKWIFVEYKKEVNSNIIVFKGEWRYEKNNSTAPVLPPVNPPSTGGGGGGGGGGGSSTPTQPQAPIKTEAKFDGKSPILNGYPDNTFRPSKSITKAEVVKILALFVNESENKKKASFKDVKQGSWYENSLNKLFQNNIIDDSELFMPDKNITRAELAVMIAKIKGLSPVLKTVFKDKADTNEIQSYINAIQQKGYINGYEDNTFRPNAEITRAEIAKIIAIAFDVKTNNKELKFSDVSKNHWAYDYILRLV